MINFNGKLVAKNTPIYTCNNSGITFGDALIEHLKVDNGQILFWEEHYLKLMASMRILRMNIPMNFTLEFLNDAVENLLMACQFTTKIVLVDILVFREKDTVSYCVEIKGETTENYQIESQTFEVELYKDFYTNTDMLATLNTNYKLVEVLGGIYAKENAYNGCLLLNHQKQIIGAVSGTLFVIKGNQVKTALIGEGAKDTVIRKIVIDILKKNNTLSFLEATISPFELQKADEMFIVSTKGIQPITKYRKKTYVQQLTNTILNDLNAHIATLKA